MPTATSLHTNGPPESPCNQKSIEHACHYCTYLFYFFLYYPLFVLCIAVKKCRGVLLVHAFLLNHKWRESLFLELANLACPHIGFVSSCANYIFWQIHFFSTPLVPAFILGNGLHSYNLQVLCCFLAALCETPTCNQALCGCLGCFIWTWKLNCHVFACFLVVS